MMRCRVLFPLRDGFTRSLTMRALSFATSAWPLHGKEIIDHLRPIGLFWNQLLHPLIDWRMVGHCYPDDWPRGHHSGKTRREPVGRCPDGDSRHLHGASGYVDRQRLVAPYRGWSWSQLR